MTSPRIAEVTRGLTQALPRGSVLVEYALRAVLADEASTPLWAYQTARCYAERYDASYGTGLTLIGLDLRASASRRHSLQLIAEYASAHPGQPIWGHGWDESSWPDNAAP